MIEPKYQQMLGRQIWGLCSEVERDRTTREFSVVGETAVVKLIITFDYKLEPYIASQIDNTVE